MRHRHTPWLVLAVTLLFTVAAAWYVAMVTRDRERGRFLAAVGTTVANVESRLEGHLTLLTATEAFLATSDTVTRDMFRAFVRRLDLERRHAGVLGIGYSVRVPRARAPALVAAMREQGDTAFRLQPVQPIQPGAEPGAADVHAIVYLEPLDARNRAAIGFDMFSEPARRAAMEQARDNAQPAASGRVELVQEITREKQAGFLVYVPVYAGGRVPPTVDQRRARLLGFVYSPFRAGDLLRAVTGPHPEVAYRVYDGATPTAPHLLFDSDSSAESGPPAFTTQRTIRVAGRTWTLVFRSGPALIEADTTPVSLLVGIGLLTSGLLFVLARSLVSARERAERSATERRQSDEALRLSERRFRSLVEQSPLSVQVLDATGRTITVNRSFERMWGVTTAELADYNILEDAQLAERGLLPLIRGAFEGRAVALPPSGYVPDRGTHEGSELWVRAFAYPVRDDDAALREVVLIHEDITDRRRVEQRLRYQLELMDAITSNAAEAMFLMDAEGRITFVNPAGVRTFGWSREEMLGRNLHALLHHGHPTGESYAVDACPLREMLTSGRALRDHEDVFLRQDGEQVIVSCSNAPILVNGRTTGAVLVARDITQRRQAEAALRASEQRLRAIFDQVAVGIGYADITGVLREVNPRLGEMLGYTPEELVGRPTRDLTHPEDLAATAEALEAVARTGASRALETRYLRRDGTVMWAAVSLSALRNSAGDVDSIVGIVEDVTERRQAEDALRHTQKLESIGVLAGGIAHDFNNLLTGIMGNASLALRTLPGEGGELTAPLLEDVIRASERAADLTQQLLAYAGKGRFFLHEVRLDTLVAELTGLIRTSIPKKVEVRLELEPDLPPVEADAGQLQQLVMNLVINGAEAIGDAAGVVTVRTERVYYDAAALRQAFPGYELAPGPYVRLEVRDTGHGMDAATQAQIFDPFFTTKFTGRGLGLAAALGIVRGHHGAIAVESAPHAGTTFTVVLPAVKLPSGTASGDGAAAGTAEPGTVADGHSRGTILVVDDEPLVREIAEAVLVDFGYEVLLAGDGREAVELFRREADRVSLVLLDLTMPVLGGEEAIHLLHEIRPGVPVIVTSGFGEAATLERFSGTAVHGFLPKPFSAEQLERAVGEALA